MNNRTNEDYEQQRNKQVAGMRSVLDYGMGIFIIIIGVVILYKYWGDVSYSALGVLSVLYGVWRIYRGYRKNYF